MLNYALLGPRVHLRCYGKGGGCPGLIPKGGTDDAQGGNAAGTYDQVDQ